MQDTETPSAEELARLPLDERAKKLTEAVTALEKRLEETAEPERD